MLTNVRTPTHNRGDIEAMIAACERGKERFVELLRRYGKDAVLEAANDWLGYSERMLRQEIAKVPDGEYDVPMGWMDDDGKNYGTRLPVKIKVIIDGDTLTIDTTGSSSETETAFNSPYMGAVMSAATYIVRTIFLDEVTYDVFVPQNEGMLAPVNVIAPEGSIFNPRFPRATKARFCQIQRMVDFTLRALAPVIPEKITAGNSAATTFFSYSGFDPEDEEYWVYLEVNEGSHGGKQGADGWDTVDSLVANTRNNPIEELEWRFPMRTERYELRDDLAAPGAGVAGSAPCGSTASSSTRSSPARVSASTAIRPGGSSAGTRASWPGRAAIPTRRARSSGLRSSPTTGWRQGTRSRSSYRARVGTANRWSGPRSRCSKTSSTGSIASSRRAMRTEWSSTRRP